MGCDIHSYAERKNDKGEWEMVLQDPFNERCYGIFGFLADVRNYSQVPPIRDPRGIPSDVDVFIAQEYESWGMDVHSASWLSVEELINFDYDAIMEDRRCIINNNGGSTCAPGKGCYQTFRDFLGEYFFKRLDELKEVGAERVVFWFDN